MPTKKNSEDPKQIDRFKEAAREIGCDEDEARFDEKLDKLVKHKPAAKRNTPSEQSDS